MNTTKMTEESTMTQPVKVLYTAKAHTTGGREGGASRTSDGRLAMSVREFVSLHASEFGGRQSHELHAASR